MEHQFTLHSDLPLDLVRWQNSHHKHLVLQSKLFLTLWLLVKAAITQMRYQEHIFILWLVMQGVVGIQV